MANGHETEGGFTLVETLVSFVILTGVIVGSMSAMTQALQRMRRSTEITLAVELAQSVFKSVATRRLGGIKSTTGTQGDLAWRIEILPLGRSTQQGIQPALIKIRIMDRQGEYIQQAAFESILMLQNGP